MIAFLLLYFKKKSKKLFAALSTLAPTRQVVHATAPRTSGGEEAEIQEEFEEMIIPEKRKPKLVDKMQQTAKEEPEEIAKVIKTMMVD